MRLKFWRWAHVKAEQLWHWIYYNRLPEGIENRRLSKLQPRAMNVEVSYQIKDWRDF
jgi:hypothetical protein